MPDLVAAGAAGGNVAAPGERLRVIDVVRQYTSAFLQRSPRQAAPHVRSTLAKLSLCRTSALGGRTYGCSGCGRRHSVYNSCRDRHCPLCGGAKRADWLDKTSELLLPQIDYFQVVFTLPDKLSSLVLGNRRALYRLLFHAAWSSLGEVLLEQGFEPAALLVLHTWNQELGHHPHVHALVPGGGPSLSGHRFVRSGHRFHRRRTKPYLTDHAELGRRFRAKFVAGLRRLHRRGELRLAEGSRLSDVAAFAEWSERLPGPCWNVFIEPPPANSSPEQVLKYLARYLVGGPISDRRLISCAEGQVTFFARNKQGRSRPFTLSGAEFVRRWSLHILPKGFTKCRRYGGFSPSRWKEYRSRCRVLLRLSDAEESLPDLPPSPSEPALQEPLLLCPSCRQPLLCLVSTRRRSWSELFRDDSKSPWCVSLAVDSCCRAPPDD